MKAFGCSKQSRLLGACFPMSGNICIFWHVFINSGTNERGKTAGLIDEESFYNKT